MVWVGISISACVSGNFRLSPVVATKVEIPPRIEELTITSQGKRMAGLAYIAAGEGPHPTVVLLHGYPGNEKNLDLAQALRAQGWNVVFFHYRGAWGSEGEFSFRGAEQDVQTVIRYLKDPKTATKLNINTQSISTVGHSMGGHMAIAGFLDNPNVICAVALDGANMGVNKGKGLFLDSQAGKVWRDYSDNLFMLEGWSGEKAVRETEQFGQALDLIPRAYKATTRPVLLIAADSSVIPIDAHIKPLFEALNNVPGSQISLRVIKDDHSFSASRDVVIDTTQRFLDKHCR